MSTSFMFWNLFESAMEIRNGDPSRWQLQAQLIRRRHPDVLAVTEGWGWHLDDRALFRRALVDFGYADGALYESKTGCDMAVLWQRGITLSASEGQPLTEAWWHGYLYVTLRLPGRPDQFVVMVSHYNPFDVTLRRIEGSFLRTRMQYTDRGVLVLDANSVAPGDPEPSPWPSRNLPGHSESDRTPLETLAEIGLVDVGAAFNDRTPTHGHYDLGPRSQKVSLRLDQAWATPSVSLTGYRVIDDVASDPEVDTASDHRPIWFTID